MKFFRIFPEICARTWCLLSNSTRNIALGKASSTVATTSIASSLAISVNPPQRAACLPGATGRAALLLKRQNIRAIAADRHHVLEVGGECAVGRHRSPVVRQNANPGSARINHGLDRQHHPLL